MNYVLLILVILVCGGAYYDHTNLQKIAQDDRAGDQKQISDLTAQVDKLEADNKKLEDENAGLTKNLNDAKSSLNDMTALVQNAQKQAEDAQKQLAQATAPKTQASSPAGPGNNLGTVATLDGKSFENCQLLKVEADGITFSHSAGITKVLYGLLRPELQQRFGYDPHVTTGLTDAQVQLQEEQRKIAAQTIGK